MTKAQLQTSKTTIFINSNNACSYFKNMLKESKCIKPADMIASGPTFYILYTDYVVCMVRL